MRRTFFPIAFLLLTQGAQAIDLNAQVPDTPTIGSEIARGIDAARTCYFDHIDSPLQMSGCIFRVSSAYTQSHSNHQPFDFGLFFGAWMQGDNSVIIAHNLSGNEVAQDRLPSAEEETQEMFAVFRNLQTKLGLSDTQVLDAAHVTKAGRDMLQQRILYWSQRPHSGPVPADQIR